MFSILPGLISLLGLVYIVGVIALCGYFVLLFRRQALAQERIAAAVERMAGSSSDSAAIAGGHTSVDAST